MHPYSVSSKQRMKRAKVAFVIVITFYSPSCLGQETAKGLFGLRVELPPVDLALRKLHAVPLIAERKAAKLWIPIFIVSGLTRPRIKPESTVSVTNALSTRPLIDYVKGSRWIVSVFSSDHSERNARLHYSLLERCGNIPSLSSFWAHWGVLVFRLFAGCWPAFLMSDRKQIS